MSVASVGGDEAIVEVKSQDRPISGEEIRFEEGHIISCQRRDCNICLKTGDVISVNFLKPVDCDSGQIDFKAFMEELGFEGQVAFYIRSSNGCYFAQLTTDSGILVPFKLFETLLKVINLKIQFLVHT